jgi:hypothetical protein
VDGADHQNAHRRDLDGEEERAAVSLDGAALA